jgi:hypothetical protein
MNWFTRSIAAMAIGGVLAACGGGGPQQVYFDMATAAEFGDTEGFLKAFTPESRMLIESQISLTEAYGLTKQNPVSLLVFPNIDEIEEREDEVVLSVSRSNAKRRILMVKTDEGWKIDVKKLAKFWDEERRKR